MAPRVFLGDGRARSSAEVTIGRARMSWLLWLVGGGVALLAVAVLLPGMPDLERVYSWPGQAASDPERSDYPAAPLRTAVRVVAGTVVGEVALLAMMLGTLVTPTPEVVAPYEAPAPPAPTVRRIESPVAGHRVSYPFGVRDKSYQAGYHTGADYAAPAGTPIVSVLDGQVMRADWGGAYGNWTLIKCSDGRVWLYAHQSERVIRAGDVVRAGQLIGYVGATGNARGPHLHLEKSTGPTWAYAKVENPIW